MRCHPVAILVGLLGGIAASCSQMAPDSEPEFQKCQIYDGSGSGSCWPGSGSDAGPPDAEIDGPPLLPDADPDLICTEPPPPLPTLPNINRRFELKGNDAIPGSDTVAEIKLGVEIRSEGMSGGPGMECEAQSKANLLGYLFVKILGQEAGVSISGGGAQHICKTKDCREPPQYSCETPQCETGSVNGAVAVYRGVEWKLCDKIKALGWFGKQVCKFVDVKASARIGLGANATIESTAGTPTGGCTQCCTSGKSKGSLEAGPSVLLEGKAAAVFKLWKLEIEAGVGAKGCASLQGKIGTNCEGPFADVNFYYYGALCIETMVAPGINFRIINNEAQVCIPLGFWEKCFNFPRCWKTNTDAGRACPSGTPNPE